jgi:hypothetical protein
MIDKWLHRWNRWGVLTSQIALMAILFLYGLRDYSSTVMIAFAITILLAQAHHQWVHLSLDGLIDQANHKGNFKSVARLAWIHQDYVVLGSALLAGISFLSLWLINDLTNVPYSMMIILLAGFNASWRTTLRYQATPIIIQAVALRRLLLIVGGLVLFFFDPRAEQGVWLFLIVIVALSISALRLLIGHLQRYKEQRYRRQFEDSGQKESYVKLATQIFQAYGKNASMLLLPVLMGLTISVVFRVVLSSIEVVSWFNTIVVVFGGVLFARIQVASLIPAVHDWATAFKTQNMSNVRDQLALIIERMVFRSALAGVVLVVALIASQVVLEGWILAVLFLAATVVLMTLQVYVLQYQVAYLTRPTSRLLMDGIAAIVLITNAFLLTIYYPTWALLISFLLMLIWWHLATLREWVDSMGFEWRIHVIQCLKVLSGFVIAMVANTLILLVVAQVPLAVDPSIQGIVLAVIFVMITSVIVYSLNAVWGLKQTVRSTRVFLQETMDSIMSYEEEVSLW